MKIWRNWCEKVEAHNEPLMKDWVCSEETWRPCYIFFPIIVGVAMMLLCYFCSYNIVLSIVLSIAMGGLTGLLLFANWKAYS